MSRYNRVSSFAAGAVLPFLALLFFANDDENQVGKIARNRGRSIPLPRRSIEENVTNKASSRILCWMMTDANVSQTVLPGKRTWWKRCDRHLFFSSSFDPDLPAIGLDVAPGRGHIAKKSRSAWRHIRLHYLKKADFFLKADPDSFVAVDNLRRYLATRDPQAPEFYGHKLKYNYQWHEDVFDGSYAAGQAVVLTREAVKRLVDRGIKPDCFMDGEAEDLKTGACLAKVGVYLSDTRDMLGRETFYPPIHLGSIFTEVYPQWYIDYREGMQVCQDSSCLSDLPVVFHYTFDYMMYTLDYFFHQQHTTDWLFERDFNVSETTFNGTLSKVKHKLGRLEKQFKITPTTGAR